MEDERYARHYVTSRALVVGIDIYDHAHRLSHAVSDANAISDLLVSDLGFPRDHVTLLTDADASRASILRAFFSFAGYGSEFNDRLVIFFAGHGHTVESYRGNVGYLVPCDGDVADLSSLIGWDEMTRGADHFRAKHVLFMMDACNSGLAVTRSMKPGAMRLLSDMMTRLSRQVLTAGKADEVVSDAGGPVPKHSVFTGNLMEALKGAARTNDGILTANGVISYVYQAVGADPASEQTPHFGYLRGDGDLIFDPVPLKENSIASEAGAGDNEVLISVPAILLPRSSPPMDANAPLKEFLSEDKFRIQLHDLIAQSSRELLLRTGRDHFANSGAETDEALLERFHNYEFAVQQLLPQVMLVGRWGKRIHTETLRLPIRRLSERITPEGGITGLLNSRWYPVLLLLYSAGIGCCAGGNFSGLKELFYCPVPNPFGRMRQGLLLVALTRNIVEIHSLFKLLPGHERQYAPKSEYLYHFLQPLADDMLYVGGEWDDLFDRFEILYSLECIHIENPVVAGEQQRFASPVGRFGWKAAQRDSSQVTALQEELQAAGEQWPPLQAGLLGGSAIRANELLEALTRTIKSLQWY